MAGDPSRSERNISDPQQTKLRSLPKPAQRDGRRIGGVIAILGICGVIALALVTHNIGIASTLCFALMLALYFTFHN